jgi:hypothetical protein
VENAYGPVEAGDIVGHTPTVNIRVGLTARLIRTAGAVAAIVIAQAPALPVQSDWTLPAAASGYTGTTTGLATDASGATIAISRAEPAPGGPPPPAFGNVSTRVPADTLRGRRLTLRADLQTRGAGGASLWMRVDRGPGDMLMLENGQDRAVRGDVEKAPFVISLPIPSSATTVVFGVLLQGAGAVTATAVRLDAGPALSPASIADDAKTVLDAAITIVRRNAWMRDKIDWTVVEPEVRLLAAGAERSADTYPAIQFLLGELKDRHSFLMQPSTNAAFEKGGAENPPVEVRTLPDGIGYINVPGYGGGDRAAMQSYAKKVHQDLGKIVEEIDCGWIIDLRNNTGGNMWPMLAGLKPFLGDEPLGAFISREGTSPPWKAGQAVDVEPPGSLRRLERAWAAVLTGPRTASSGEAVTISFKGRVRTRSFGQPTAGLSSANQAFQLPDGAAIILTVSIEADRTGKQYGEKVDPDEVIAALAPGASEPDAALNAATAWLRRSCAG